MPVASLGDRVPIGYGLLGELREMEQSSNVIVPMCVGYV